MLDSADKAIDLLEFMPEMNCVVDDELLSQKGIRKALIKKYIAFYVIYDELQTVYVLRILHSSSNRLSVMRNDAAKL